MKFKGRNWRRTRTVLELPYEYVKENYDDDNYIRFGKIVKAGTKGAIPSHYTYSGSGQPVYLKPIKCAGHSRTNMMYGNYELRDGLVYTRAYLKLDGIVYTARWYLSRKTEEYVLTGKVVQD